MDSRRVVRVIAFVALLCFVLAVAVEYADAAAAKASKVSKVSKASGDQSLAQKKGIAASLGTKKTDESKKATKLQMMLGIGSVFVAIAVIKWL